MSVTESTLPNPYSECPSRSAIRSRPTCGSPSNITKALLTISLAALAIGLIDAAIEASLDNLEYTWAFHREVHDGAYVGIHQVVDLELPNNEQILANMENIDWSFAAGRGLPSEDLLPRFRSYIESCQRTFRVELILTSFDDLVESEFGVGIHEQRILDQRSLANDYGRIARNASFIIEYMLRLAVSKTIAVDELPFKIWGRYIRDTVDHEIRKLHGEPPVDWLVPEEHLEDLMRL